MRLATWNVNSIRARVDRVTDWLERADVDVLAMQETKCSDDQFPTMPFVALGYDVVHCGFNQWNGVAIASRVGIDDVQVGFDGQPTWSDKPDVEAAAEARALGATCDGVRVWSLYVPNGRTVDSPHYDYKLEWLAALRDTARGWLAADPSAQIALVGDWNIAPTDEDVWSRRVLRGQHARHPAGTRGVHRDRRRPVRRRGAAFHARARRLHLLGLHPAARSRRTGACASTSSSARRPLRSASRMPRSSARNAKARHRATTHRSWSSCPNTAWG